MTKRVRIGRLLATYGPLLTKKQREFVGLHHDEDLSFGEIAREFKVSRQAVHDAVRQAEVAMERYESGLQLLGKGRSTAGAEPSSIPGPVVEKLRRLRHRLASQGIIYDTAEHVRVLDEVLAQLTQSK